MNKQLFEIICAVAALSFTIAFCAVVVPPLWDSGDIWGALAAGFVNPYASGYSLDVLFSAFVLIIWIVYDRAAFNVRYGWVAIPICLVPGVAPALAIYLIIRGRQL